MRCLILMFLAMVMMTRRFDSDMLAQKKEQDRPDAPLGIRIEGIGDTDAGNYEGFLLYDEDMYGTPGSIRKTLQEGTPFLRTARPLPGFWESLSCTLGQVTNWSSFAGDLSFEG